jgi:hypothetical protein
MPARFMIRDKVIPTTVPMEIKGMIKFLYQACLFENKMKPEGKLL